MLKKTIAAIFTGVLLLSSSPARADQFSDLLQTVLTPDEAAIHKTRGTAKAEKLAQEACKSLDAGKSMNDFAVEISQSLIQEGLSQAQLQNVGLYSSKVIAYGIAAYCPQHLPTLEELRLPSASGSPNIFPSNLLP
ncbi:MAG: DUF732 domain-containing protein [Microcoleaceae cyanobacterium]